MIKNNNIFRIIKNKNIYLQLCLWIISVICARAFNSSLFYLLPILFFVCNELMYLMFSIDFYDQRARTKLFYDLTTWLFIKTDNGTLNLSEGLYPDDYLSKKNYNILPDEAESKKFDKIFELLNLQKGDSLLDIGCGNGNWVKYCTENGVNAIGMTISPLQHSFLVERNINAIIGDYSVYNANLCNKFDCITALGSTEHLTSGKICHPRTVKKQDNELFNVLNNVKKYFKPESTKKRIFISALHINPSFKNCFNTYILERSYGAVAFNNIAGERLPDKATECNFEIIFDGDFTKHYYIASVTDVSHFGRPSKFCLRHVFGLMIGFVLNPFLIHIIIYTCLGCWMWIFDGKPHKYSNSVYEHDFTFEQNSQKRPLTLVWCVLKYKS